MSSSRPPIAGAIKPRAVLVGGVVDLFGTIMAGFVLMNAYAITRIAGGALTLEDLERNGGLDFLQMYLGDSLVLVANLLLGLLMTAVGGYVAARLAGGVLPLFHGLLAGVASLVGGFVFFGGGGGAELPGWMLVLGYLLHLPAAVLGGWWRRGKIPVR